MVNTVVAVVNTMVAVERGDQAECWTCGEHLTGSRAICSGDLTWTVTGGEHLTGSCAICSGDRASPALVRAWECPWVSECRTVVVTP